MRKNIDIYFKYMWNAWNEDICQLVFPTLYKHIWYKWMQCIESCGSIGAPAMLWSLLDDYCQQQICDHAAEYYA